MRAVVALKVWEIQRARRRSGQRLLKSIREGASLTGAAGGAPLASVRAFQ